MKYFFLASAIFCILPLAAQTFVQEKPVIPAFSQCGAVLVDVDNDQDEDLFIMGYDLYNRPVSELHLNDGLGNFSRKADMPFLGLAEGTVAFADVDGDQDQDVLIAGLDSTHAGIHTKLYFNDGNGNFTEASGTNFIVVASPMIAFADVDGDNDQDVLITGRGASGIARLYMNNGAGIFSEMLGTPFIGLSWGRIIFSDLDSDQDLDVFIQGSNGYSYKIAYYINDGTGQFVPGTNPEINNLGAIDFTLADYDGDQDQDLLVSNTIDRTSTQFTIFANDGAGNFSTVSNNVPVCPTHRYLAVTDIDADGDPDCFFTETRLGLQPIGKLFLNEGSGNFTELPGTPFTAVAAKPTLFADVDKNGRQDILSFGDSEFFMPTGKLFLQTGNLFFNKPRGPHFPQLASEVVAFADIDGDQDQDLLVAGDNAMVSTTKLFTNDGTGQFEEVLGSSLTIGANGSAKFFDADGDQDQDLVAFSHLGSKLYRNDGTGKFSEAPESLLDNLSLVALAVSDVDGDQDIDILVTGSHSDITNTILYLNDGNGVFIKDAGTPFPNLIFGDVAFADIDGDLDQDIVISGSNATLGKITKLYRNDGAGGFSEDFNNLFEGVGGGLPTFADVDGDQDQDLLITGLRITSPRVAKLYINDSQGNFSEIVPSPFHASRETAAAFADVDQDGDLDVMLTGSFDTGIGTKLYINAGAGNFTEANNMPFIPVVRGTLAFADIDNDKDPDVYITGMATMNLETATLYRNTTFTNAQDSTVVNDTPAFRIYPNPAVSEDFTVEFDAEAPTSVRISLFDVSGKVLFESITSVLPGKQTLEFHYPLAIAPGLYWVRVAAEGRSAVTKVVIH